MIRMNELGTMNTGFIQMIGIIVRLCASNAVVMRVVSTLKTLEPSFRAAKIEGGHPHTNEGTRHLLDGDDN